METQRLGRGFPDCPDRFGGPRPAEPLSVARSEASAAPLWAAHAAQWSLIDSPLRPHPQDLAVAQRAVDRFAGESKWYALLLGVTRELADLHWPRGAALVAADLSAAMLEHEWRSPPGCASLAVRCRWQALPVARGTVSLALGDGSLSALPDVESIRSVLEQVATALRPDGCLVLRAYTRPEIPESPWQVLDDLLGGRTPSIHVAKWRLAMALHGTLSSGVVLERVWKVFRQAVPDSRKLAARTGWSVASIDTIDAYRGARSRYLFPTLAELRALLSPWFAEVDCEFPTYELGDRCPTLTLRLR
jgi:SAM-dependent methyltransferase